MMTKKYILIFFLFLLGIPELHYGQRIKIASETGKVYTEGEILYIRDGVVVQSEKVSFSNVNIKKNKDMQIAVRLPGHLPLLYSAKKFKEIDLRNPENVKGVYKIKEGQVQAIVGDFNGDYQINAMDLFLFQKYTNENNLLADLNGDGKIDETDKKIIMENNDKLYRTGFLK